MTVVDRYLIREVAGASAGVLAVLLLVMFSAFVGDYLGDVAAGDAPAGLMLELVGLAAIESLTLLGPVSMFFGILLGLGRLYRDNEMTILGACGLGWGGLGRALGYVAVPGVLALAAIALWAAPWAARVGYELRAEAAREVTLAGIQAGRFQELASGGAMVYAERAVDGGTALGHVYVHQAEGRRIDVVTAERVSETRDPQTNRRFLVLHNGQRVQGEVGERAFRRVEFERQTLAVPEIEEGRQRLKFDARPVGALWASSNPRATAELHWRLASPLSFAVLAVLALPLARTGPQASRYGRLMLGLLVYVLYLNLLGLGQEWIEQGVIPPPAGLWWVHAPALALALAWSWRIRNANARDRARRK